MKAKHYRLIAALAAAMAVGGCASNSPSFSWYHPQGGEFLFAYDRDDCTGQVERQGLVLGTDTRGPFFRCMHERGYYLVNEAGIVQAPEQVLSVASPQVSQQ